MNLSPADVVSGSLFSLLDVEVCAVMQNETLLKIDFKNDNYSDATFNLSIRCFMPKCSVIWFCVGLCRN